VNDPTAAAERFRSVRQRLMTAAGLGESFEALTPAQALRVSTATWLSIAKQNAEVRLLMGEAVDTRELTELANAITALLPVAAPSLQVEFIGTIDRCPVCDFRRESPPDYATARRPGHP
jgi:hypothetical protein